ncbi:MAG: hypothetical protein WAM21_00755 [Steroidobacteraceae bacterium]
MAATKSTRAAQAPSLTLTIPASTETGRAAVRRAVESLNEAISLYEEARDKSGEGASTFAAGEVTASSGERHRISYNGRLAEAQEPAPHPAENFDSLRGELLGVIQHFRLADFWLQGEFAELPDAVQAAATVVHRATDELNRLHSKLDSWHVTHTHATKPRLTEEEIRARSEAIMEGQTLPADVAPAERGSEVAGVAIHPRLAEHLFDQQQRVCELQETLQMLVDRIQEGASVVAGCVRVVRNLNEALDSNSLRKVLDAAGRS